MFTVQRTQTYLTSCLLFAWSSSETFCRLQDLTYTVLNWNNWFLREALRNCEKGVRTFLLSKAVKNTILFVQKWNPTLTPYKATIMRPIYKEHGQNETENRGPEWRNQDVRKVSRKTRGKPKFVSMITARITHSSGKAMFFPFLRRGVSAILQNSRLDKTDHNLVISLSRLSGNMSSQETALVCPGKSSN